MILTKCINIIPVYIYEVSRLNLVAPHASRDESVPSSPSEAAPVDDRNNSFDIENHGYLDSDNVAGNAESEVISSNTSEHKTGNENNLNNLIHPSIVDASFDMSLSLQEHALLMVSIEANSVQA